MSIHNEIKAIILRALPSLTEEIREHVITSLERSGVESIEDLVYVQQEDLKDVLPIIQQRKLLEAFKLGKVLFLFVIIIIINCFVLHVYAFYCQRDANH